MSPAVPVSKQDQAEARRQELHADALSRFEALATDGVGTLDAAKARQLAASLGLVMTEEQALQAMAVMNPEGVGHNWSEADGTRSASPGVTFEQFYEWFLANHEKKDSGRATGLKGLLSSAAEAVSKQAELANLLLLETEARSMFEEVDADGSGTLDADEVRDLASRLGVTMTDEQVQEAMTRMDAVRLTAVCFHCWRVLPLFCRLLG